MSDTTDEIIDKMMFPNFNKIKQRSDMAKVKKQKLKVKKESKIKRKPPTLDQLENELDLELPKKKNVPSSNIEDYNFLIYGNKGIGKTSLAAQFDDSITLQFEPGGKGLKTFQRPCPSWIHFRKYISMLEEDPSRYKNIVIDTASLAYDRCLDYACEKAGINHPSDGAWGAGWKAVSKEFNSTMARAGMLGLGFFAICHDMNKEIETRSGRKYHKTQPNLTGQAEAFFSGPIDVVGYYHQEDGQRWLLIRPEEDVEAKCRLEENFIALDGKPVYKVPMGDNPKEAYENLVEAFNNEQEDSFTPEASTSKLKKSKTKKSKTKRKK